MGKKIGAIVLAALFVVMCAAGVFGIAEKKRIDNEKDSVFTVYQNACEDYDLECRNYQAIAETALQNMDSYIAQIETNRALMVTLGGDPAEIDALIKDAQAKKEEALKAQGNMETHYAKMTEQATAVTEQSADADITANQEKVMMRRNKVKTELKKITKIDEGESVQSCETVVRKDCEKSAALITAAYPEAELPEQFTVVKEAAESTEIQVEKQTFGEFLAANWQYCFWLAAVMLFAAALCFVGWFKPELLDNMTKGAKKNMMLIALVGITLLFFVLTNYTLLTPKNVSNIILQNAYIIILACGMLLCIVSSGNIDLSVGRVMGFVGACAAKFMIEGKMNTWLAVGLCLLIGIAIGAWQGFWIAYMKIPAFVVTLAGQLTFYGLTMVILKGFTINNFPSDFQTVFNSYLPDIFGGKLLGINLGINVLALLVGIVGAAIVAFAMISSYVKRKKKGYEVEKFGALIAKVVIICAALIWLFYSLADATGIPSVLITVGIVLLIYAFITSKTVMGRHLYAMGGNVNAARLSGVKTQRMLFLAYVNMGFLAALAGLVYASRLNGASPQAGQGDETFAIASCYIGGASAYGGIGTIGGALIGALTMGVIKNGMSIMSLGQDIQQIVLGLVLLFAVVIDIISKQGVSLFKGKKSTHHHKKE